jgi:hypothetical protein
VPHAIVSRVAELEVGDEIDIIARAGMLKAETRQILSQEQGI